VSNRTRTRLAWALTLGLLLIASPARGADERPVVWCVGDSVAYQLCKGLDDVGFGASWTLVNHGAGSDTTLSGIPRLIDLLLSEPTPDLVVVQYGSGDFVSGSIMGLPGFTPEEVYERLRVVEAILTWFSADMVWTTTPVRALGGSGYPDIDAYLRDHFVLNRLIDRISMRTPPSQFVDFAHPHRRWIQEKLAPRLGKEVARRLHDRGFSKTAAGYR